MYSLARHLSPAKLMKLSWRSLVCLPALPVLALLLGCGTGYSGTVSVAPLAGEDLQTSCKYDLLVVNPIVEQRGVFVVFERGDTADVYNDTSVRELASDLHYAMLFAHQCNAYSVDNIQDDAAKGPGRALLAALNEFGKGHYPEVAKAKLILFGFSASGYLAGSMMNYAPDRVVATVQLAPAAPTLSTSLDDLNMTAASLSIPSLILAHADDLAAGTTRPQNYYLRAKAAGAPWTFAIKDGVGHSGSALSIPLLIPYLRAVVPPPANVGSSKVAASISSAVYGDYTCSFDGWWDSAALPDCHFTAASLSSKAAGSSSTWLPDEATADAWLQYVRLDTAP
jgi:pimeloyl-ACP methyl ester carboxylesterase